MKDSEKLTVGCWLLLAALASGVGCGALSLGALETMHLCLFRALTGLRCPGCGMGHALIYAFLGRWTQSFAYHPLGIPLWLGWTAWTLNGFWNRLRAKPFSLNFPLRLGTAQGLFALAALLAAHALR